MRDFDHGSGGGSSELQSGPPPSLIVGAVHEAVGRRPVILCGSWATGEATRTSDVDVAVPVPFPMIPRAAIRLGRAAQALEAELGVDVSVNPVRRGLLRRPESNLFAWKLCREGKLLYPEGGRLPPAPPRAIDRADSFSYLLSAVFFLLESIDPADLRADPLPPAAAGGARKALLHLAQLRLMREGGYASTLADAVEALGDPVLRAAAARLETAEGWLAVRDLVLAALADGFPDHTAARDVLRNLQYAAVSALRGRRRAWALGRRASVERDIATAAVHLLAAVGPRGAIDTEKVREAAARLPAALRPARDADWPALRSTCALEWAGAHPLMGI